MRVAIIGSRQLTVDISKYIPEDLAELVSGGAIGIDQLAEHYTDENNIPKLILKPEYEKFGKGAPLERNKAIVEVADLVIAVWDGRSRGTKFTIDYAKEIGKPVEVHIIS